jgi:single-stranded-DNA-specific exonuclease
VDGVTSTVLLLEVLRELGWKVNSHLPHRMEEGYGLTSEGVENCLRRHPSTLLVAVDCGSTAVETISGLAARGVDVIVLDHHQVSNPAPPAVALVNPQIGRAGVGNGQPEGCFTELCSAGLAFKLAHALVKRGRELEWVEAVRYDLRSLLDLVALGTIADLVPLKGENRILVSAGLERLAGTTRPGLVALKEVAGVGQRMGVYEVGFQLAPRLNAAGRLESAEESLELLMAKTAEEAEGIAQQLDSRNRERQRIERGIAEEVIGALEARFDPLRDFVIVEGGLLWHLGVVGIVASRVLQKFYRPTIIVGGEGTEWRGSGRSIEGFDLAAALRECGDLLLRHGGHAMAAGLTLAPEKLEPLRRRLNELARARLQPEQLQRVLRLDATVPLAEMTMGLLEALERLSPVGQGNPPVQVVVPSLRLQRPPQFLGRERKHARLRVTDGAETFEALCWNCVGSPLPDGCFDLAVAPQINVYNGRSSVQLKVLDWRPAQTMRGG